MVLVSGLFADPQLRWVYSNSEFFIHHFAITRAYGILAGEISKDDRNAGMVTVEQFGFVMH